MNHFEEGLTTNFNPLLNCYISQMLDSVFWLIHSNQYLSNGMFNFDETFTTAHFLSILSESQQKWSLDDLTKAVTEMHSKQLSYRDASRMFCIPKSTLYLYKTGQVEIGSKQGPPSVLTTAEEERLVQYAVHMSCIGYGRTKEQILDIVQKLVQKDNRPNPFSYR